MKKIKLFIAAHLMLVWLIVIIMLMTASISFGAYTYMKYAGRVVSTVNDNGQPFSSNLLSQAADEKSLTNSLSTFSENKTETRIITVCNYPQNNIDSLSLGDIDYYFRIKVKKIDGTVMSESEFSKLGIDIGVKRNSGETVNITSPDWRSSQLYTLSKGVVSTDIYTLNFKLKPGTDYNSFDFNGFYISVLAVPTEETRKYAGSNMLAKNLLFTKSRKSQGWSGKFVDDFSNHSSDDYDAFNYEVKGNGAGTVTITWDTTYVDIDPLFAGSLGSKQISSAEDGTLSFYVGGEYKNSNYRIQFYRVVPYPENEKFINGYVTNGEEGNIYIKCEYQEQIKQ